MAVTLVVLTVLRLAFRPYAIGAVLWGGVVMNALTAAIIVGNFEASLQPYLPFLLGSSAATAAILSIITVVVVLRNPQWAAEEQRLRELVEQEVSQPLLSVEAAVARAAGIKSGPPPPDDGLGDSAAASLLRTDPRMDEGRRLMLLNEIRGANGPRRLPPLQAHAAAVPLPPSDPFPPPPTGSGSTAPSRTLVL